MSGRSGPPYSEMRWHPVPYTVPKIGFPDLCSYDDDVNQTDLFQGGADGECYADIFCAGHVQLYDGRFLVAGGNVDSTATGGGLKHTFTYMPWEGVPNGQRSGPDLVEGPFAAGENPFSWDKHGDMAVDRWYPTLTVLRDGTVLISSGASRLPYLDGQNTFELFDPETNLVAPLNITNTPFSQANPIPLYPFMFLLPNGDILYAGGEEATVASSNGRVLIPGYNNNGTWTWDERVFESTINGGSAVMYEPGKIMKSGGLHRGSQNDDPPILDEDNIARVETEIIDLSKFASGDYGIAGQKDAATDFLRRGDMNQPRHFHNLTLLPDGRVLATGGNKRSNGFAGDDELNECEYQNQPIADMDLCNDTNRDGTPDNPATAAAGCPAVPSRCLAYDPQGPLLQGNYCPLRGNTTCPDLDHVDCGAPCTNNDDTQCPPGSTCGDAGTCEMPCPEPGGEMCGAVVHCSGGLSYCDPAKNECHATQSAEIWDPSCGVWTELGEEERPRMYHSTALLLPGGEVYSMGGGHRYPLDEQASAQIFRPEYGLAGTTTAPQIHVVGETEKYNIDKPAIPVNANNNGFAEVVFLNGSPAVTAADFTLVRLGSVTHQFDMDQRFIRLVIDGGEVDDINPLTVVGPPSSGDAPPGYYMLFLRTVEGEISTGEYVQVPPTDATGLVWVCPATVTLAATRSSCTMEPIGAECPANGEQVDPMDLPIVGSPPGPVEGWHVFTPPGEIDRPLAPTSRELASLEARCVAACEAHFAGDAAIAVNCGDLGAFDAPQPFYDRAAGPYNLLLPDQQHGEGLFTGQSLACELDSTCCTSFDEDICATVADRPTPANDLLAVGQEYKVALGSTSTIQVITDQGTYTSGLTGNTGYSFCRDGNAVTPCPFYLGSFEALATSALTATMTCADNTTARARLSNLVIKLSQPALGIAEEGTSSKGFPKGALIFESAFDVGGQHFTARRPATENVIITANAATFDATDLTVALRVPCNSSTAAITVKVTARDPGVTAGALGAPPVVANTTAATGACGASRALTTTVSDPDGDAEPVRWRVDGLWMAPGTNAMVVSAAHVLDAVVRDARGATTTARKEVSCN